LFYNDGITISVIHNDIAFFMTKQKNLLTLNDPLMLCKTNFYDNPVYINLYKIKMAGFKKKKKKFLPVKHLYVLDLSVVSAFVLYVF
jgi:hypothetical protein